MQIKPAGKLVLLILAIGIAFGAWRMWNRLAPGAQGTNTVVPTVGNLPGGISSEGTGGSVTLPGSAPGCPEKPEVRLLGYAWNAQMGLLFANGGRRRQPEA